MSSERGVDGVITVRGTVQHTDNHEVGAEGKSQPKVLQGFGRLRAVHGE